MASKISFGIDPSAYHQVTGVIAACIAAITATLLAGSSPNAIGHRLYLLQIGYNTARPDGVSAESIGGAWQNITMPALAAIQDSQLRVRIGYFGLCAAAAAQEGETSSWTCRRDAAGFVESRHLFADPLGILSTADKVKEDVFFPGLLISTGGLALLSIILFTLFPGWREERDERTGSDVDVRPFPSHKLRYSCLAATGLGTLFSLISTTWQHTSSVTAATVIENSSISILGTSIGGLAVALAWVVVGLWFIAFMLIVGVELAIRTLDGLVEEDDSMA